MRQHTVLNRLLEAFLHRRDVVLGHGTADNPLRELVAGAPGQGLQFHDDMAVLAVASGLLLVLVFSVRYRCRDGLLVGHSGHLQIYADAELAPHLFRRHLKLGITHTGEQGLTGVGFTVDTEGLVFLGDAGERCPQFI